jgi:hypothetical protein
MTEIVADPPGTMVVEGARVLMDSEEPEVGGVPLVVVVVVEDEPLPQPIDAVQMLKVREQKERIPRYRAKEDFRLIDAILIRLPSRCGIGPAQCREIQAMKTECIIFTSGRDG